MFTSLGSEWWLSIVSKEKCDAYQECTKIWASRMQGLARLDQSHC